MALQEVKIDTQISNDGTESLSTEYIQDLKDKEHIITNTLTNMINALVFDEIVNSNDFVLSHVDSDRDEYIRLSEKKDGDSTAIFGNFTLDLFSEDINDSVEPRFSVGFYLQLDDNAELISDDVLYEISDSTVDNSSLEENFGYWSGSAWDWELNTINDQFVVDLQEKVSSFIDRFEKLEDKAGGDS